MIIATGALAIINVFVASSYLEQYRKGAALTAAVCAAALAIFSNLEVLWRYYDLAQTHRQSREMYLTFNRDIIASRERWSPRAFR